ncbi:MAG: hypothetical protein IJ041_09105 [Clostridia bacterium]|nr:hypothetical protein [Clostridia bacterium]
MKHTRIVALLTAILLMMLSCATAAAATNHVVYYSPVEGVEVCALEEAGDLEVPAGLEEMYALFAEGNEKASVYVFRMPNGQALLSVSCLETGAEGSTEELYAKKDALAAGLTAAYADSLPLAPEFELKEMYGQQAVTAEMTLYPPEVGMSLEARVTLFYRGQDLIEVWTMHPGVLTYLFNEVGTDVLGADLAALEELEASLDFSIPEDEPVGACLIDDEPAGLIDDEPAGLIDDEPAQTAEPAADKPASALDLLNSALGITTAEPEPTATPEPVVNPAELPRMTITADDGSFRIEAPLDTMVIHQGSDENTVARARMLFADVTGGEKTFDTWYQDVTEEGCWLLISREYGIAAQIFVSEAGNFAGATAEDLCTLEEPILQLMQERYEEAETADEATTCELDGKEHAWLTYALIEGDMELLTYVLAAADQDWLYEMDLYLYITDDTDVEAISSMAVLMMETLDYLPDMGV